MLKLRKNGALLNVVLEDITEFDGDAIVKPANTFMIMGGGVAGAIRRKGGGEIEQGARRNAPVPVGKAAVTSAYKLRCKYVIHSPTVEAPGGRSSAENAYKATRAPLEEAHKIGAKYIAFPLMGAGIGGLSPRESWLP